MSGEFLTMTLAAAGSPGDTKSFQKAGRYFEIIADGGSTINLTFYGENGAVSANWNNCQSGLFLEDPWSQFDVKNNSAGAQTITLLLMDNGRGGSRRQPGTVRILDSERDLVLSNQVFGGGVSLAAAASNAIVQLWNPVGSGKVVTVYKLRIGATLADTYSIAVNNAALNLNGQFSSHFAGGADSVAQRRSDATGMGLGTAKGLGGDFIGASGNVEFNFSRPVVLPEGFGLYTTLNTVAGQTNRTSFYFEEVPK